MTYTIEQILVEALANSRWGYLFIGAKEQ